MRPALVGVVNVTADSFSDGGRWLDPAAALRHARSLVAAGADVIEIGPASSHPDAAAVPAEEELRRALPLLEALRGEVPVSIDSFQPATQRACARAGAAFLNDTRGFPDAEVLRDLAGADCRLVVMHAVQRGGRATRAPTDPDAVVARVFDFFDDRLAALDSAGIARERIVLDPGMGFFLGNDPEPSLRVLRALPALRARFGLPLLVSVSRKSFLGALTGRDVGARGPATLAAELYAVAQGVDYVRTHDVAALADALTVTRALRDGAAAPVRPPGVGTRGARSPRSGRSPRPTGA